MKPQLNKLVIFLAATIVIALVVGCSTQTTTSPSVAPTNSPPVAASAEAMPEALGELSESDRAAALKQQVCPVSDQKLGSMGAPPKFVVDGQDVFLCCSGCEEEFHKSP